MSAPLQTNSYFMPSSVIHNSSDVRAQCTRQAARKAATRISGTLQPLYRQLRARLTWHKPASYSQS